MPIPLNLTSSPSGTRNLPAPPPESAPHGGGRDEAISAAFQEVVRQQSELASAIDRLRSAITETGGGNFGIGHNRGPAIEIEELVAEDARLLALLQDKGPNPSPADRIPIAEQAEKIPTLSERMSIRAKLLAAEGAKLGAREVAKNVTAPLWEEVARRLLELYHAIKIWLSQLV